MWFYASILGFVSGILVASIFHVPSTVVFFVLCVVASISLFFSGNNRKKYVALVLIFIGCFGMGWVRYGFVYDPQSKALLHKEGSLIVTSGKIISDPSESVFGSRFILKTEHGNMLALSEEKGFSYGDRVKVRGIITQPENFVTSAGKVFDYRKYLAKDGIYVELEHTFVLDRTEHPSLTKTLFRFRSKITSIISTYLPSDESALVNGLVLGSKSGFSKEDTNAFIATGTIHMIALSGYNVSLVAKWIETFVKVFASSTVAFSLSVFGIILFVVFTGSSSTAIRAAIMAIVVLIAQKTGRPYNVVRALLVALALMLLYNPKLLTYDVSFQLSFLATLGIIWIEPVLTQKLSWLQSRFWIGIIAPTLAAQIAVAPFILYQMGTLSLISLPINILVLPLVPLSMILGMLLYVCALTLPLLALPLSSILHYFLSFMLGSIRFGAHVPLAVLYLPEVGWLIPSICYAGIVFWLCKVYSKKEQENH